MSAQFLGRGLAFPIQPDGVGRLRYAEGQAHVEQSLKLLLLTSLGERVMRPGLGCEAPRLVFTPGSVQYLRLVETSIRDAIAEWEPRVEVGEVVAEALPGTENSVVVNIGYEIRGSNARGNLVFPFYLGQESSVAGRALP